MPIISETLGMPPDGRAALLFTLTNARGMRARITNIGGAIVSIETPDRHGALADLVLGFDALDKYMTNKPHFGCIVGRFANRIAKGRFTLDGVMYQLAVNNGPNHLHGGLQGFSKKFWEAEMVEEAGASGVRLRYVSPNGEESYPGTLACTVTYRLTDANELCIGYEAETDAPTNVNLTNHSYFNLAGHDAGEIRGHELTVNADCFTPVDATLIPTGELRPVAGTPLDFREPALIGARIDADDGQLRLGHGYDHNYVINGESGQLRFAARAVEYASGRVMEVHTTQPGMQLYTGNMLDGTHIGKGGRPCLRRTGFCLETQHFPDSPNQPGFPSVVLRPGERYAHTTVFKFGALA
ncbi:MAG: galactose mutarotase [Candidatus Hydrogenedentes bacterium]|nr:galactose mutarotase [Candidatus Hydrogenedentota bacterium]